MKLLPSLAATATAALLFAAGTTSAQTASINVPPPRTTPPVKSGKDFSFQLQRDADVTGPTTEKGVIVGFQTCGKICVVDLAQNLGKTMYNGSYNPSGPSWGGRYQTFTVTIPSDTPKGRALLGVRRTASVGSATNARPLTQYFGIPLMII